MPMLAAISGAESWPILISSASLISTTCGMPLTGFIAQPAIEVSSTSPRASARCARPRNGEREGRSATAGPPAGLDGQRALDPLEDAPPIERLVAPAGRDAVGAFARGVVDRVALGRDRNAECAEPVRRARRALLVGPLMEGVGQQYERAER